MSLQLQHSISDSPFRRLVGNFSGMIYQYVRCVDRTESFPFIGYGCTNLCEIEPIEIQHDPTAFWALTYPEDLPGLQTSIQQAIEGCQVWVMEWRIVTPSGQLKWVQTIAQSTYLENGDVVLDGVLFDISECKKKEQEHIVVSQKFNQELNQPLAAIEASMNSITMLEQRYPYLDQTDRLSFKYDEADELLDENWDKLCLYSKQEVIHQKQLTNEVVRAQEALQKCESKLLQVLIKEQELDELKSKFITNISHEFRTPLTTILGSVELLEYVSEKWPRDKKIKHYERIKFSVKQMIGLLDDLLNVNKNHASRPLIAPSLINVEKFCRDLLRDLQILTSKQRVIKFTCKSSAILAKLDENLLRQILENLISNAIKYSPQNSEVLFDCDCMANTLIFRIFDQGIGIPEADLLHLFDPFYRAGNVNTVPGVGLGLTIAKKAIDLCAGKITIDSEVGKGTRCIVELPFH